MPTTLTDIVNEGSFDRSIREVINANNALAADLDSAQTLSNKTLVAPALGAATATSLAATAAIRSSGTAGVGYSTGAGGTVTQATSKATGVTLSRVCGEVTMAGDALAASTVVSFTLTNTTIAVTDVVVINHKSGGTSGAYLFGCRPAAGSVVVSVRNVTAGSLSETLVLSFVVIKAVIA